MDWKEILTALVTVVTALGGWEMVKYLLNRKNNARKNEAEADTSAFAVLKDMIEFLSQQIADKEERFADQTKKLRETQAELIELTKKYGELELKEQKYHCEVKGCLKREPPNGY